jgi:undecaprenyl-diphosphatase
MTFLEAFFLGLIQGLTEFLPVSSSGHLELGQYFLGFKSLQKYILFNMICHLGTLCAILFFFSAQIKQCLSNHKGMFFKVCLGTLPLFPLLLIIKPIKALFDQPQYLGFCFLITSALLFAGLSIRIHLPWTGIKKNWVDSLTIGLFQASAVLPGISRSGSTISAARVLGWSKDEAIQYSFLLAIPAITGGTLLEIWQFFRMPASELAPIGSIQFIIGFATSFVVGCIALYLLRSLMQHNKWHYFAWYCLALGLLTIYYFNLG